MTEPNEIERVRALRAAFVAGANWRTSRGGYGVVEHEAARRYPMPMVTKPREIVDHENGLAYRVVGGRLEVSNSEAPHRDWQPSSRFDPFVLKLADLLQNPTVTVPADEA